jgi:putative ABC transport system permease protein
MMDPTDQESAIVPRQTLLKEIGQVGRGRSIRIQTTQTDPAGEIKIAEEIRLLYQANGYETLASNEDTSRRLADKFVGPVGVLLALLSALAAMVTLVGAIALSGTLSLDVMERTREIGVMRAVGASTAAITGQFVGEGILLGWLSWLIALPLSIPTGLIIINVFSSIFNTELIYRFAGIGGLYWFGLVTIVAAIASWFPAWKASRTSARESLAYA